MTHATRNTQHEITFRRLLAAFRLLSLYTILCSGLLTTSLLVRAAIEDGPAPTAPQPPAAAPAAQIPLLGVTVDLTQHATTAERRDALRRLHDAGFGWVRQRVDWATVEPERGNLHWAEIDAVLADIVAAQLTPVIVLDGSPAWARYVRDADNPLAPPADFADFANFAAAFADRYREDVRFYQIWDEPNIAPHWGDRLIEPVHYARLLKDAAAAIRSADVDAVIVTAALAPTRDRGHTAVDEVTFLQRLYAAGAAGDFDAVAVQPFGFGNPPSDERSRVDVLNFARLRLIRRVMVAAGDAETPIWAVRFGWNRVPNANWGTVTPLAQFDYTADAIAQSRSWPWLAALGWPIDRPAVGEGCGDIAWSSAWHCGDDPAWGFALFDAVGFPEPLLSAFLVPGNPSTSTLPPWTIPATLAAYVVFAAAVLWRGAAAMRILPLRAWITHRRSNAQPRPLAEWTIIFIILIIYYFATWPPLIGLCLIAVAVLIYARPIDGVLLAAALLPFHFQHKEINLVAFTLTLPPAHAALIATLPALTRSTRSPIPNPQSPVPNLLALAWLAISLLAALSVWHWPGYIAGLWTLVIGPVLLYVAARRFVVDVAQWRALALALGIGGCVAAGIGLVQWLSGGGVAVDGVRRLMGLTFSPNQTALYLLRTLFLLVGVALSCKGRGAWGAVGLTAVALVLTGSRGALLLGIPAGTVALLWLGAGTRRPRPWMWAALGLVLVVVGGIGLFVLGERLQNSETVLRRFAIWEGATALWSTAPWTGVGPGGFFWRYPAFIVPAAVDEPNLLHAHTVWLNVATGWGVLGLVWFGALLTWLIGVARRLRSQPVDWIAVGALAAVIASLAHAQVDAFLVLPELTAWNWLVLALLAQRELSGFRRPAGFSATRRV
ncbi:hypothetical protein GC175_20825 [bacterium]|nr:hypothetical protein [bacterium]